MTQWVKCLLCRCGGAIQMPRTHVKLDAVLWVSVTPTSLCWGGKWRQENLWNLVSQPVWCMQQWARDPVSVRMKHKGWHPGLSPDLYMHAMWTCVCLDRGGFKRDKLWYAMGHWKCFGGQLTRWPTEKYFLPYHFGFSISLWEIKLMIFGIFSRNESLLWNDLSKTRTKVISSFLWTLPFSPGKSLAGAPTTSRSSLCFHPVSQLIKYR